MEKSTLWLSKPARFHILALFFLVAAALLATVSVAQTRSVTSIDPALEKLKRGYDRLQAKDFDGAIAALPIL